MFVQICLAIYFITIPTILLAAFNSLSGAILMVCIYALLIFVKLIGDETFILIYGQVVVVFSFLVSVWFMRFASEADPSLSFSVSQHGKSSCTPKLFNDKAPYNPHGSTWDGPLYGYCPYRTSTWADRLELSPIGFNKTIGNVFVPDTNYPCSVDSACDFLASTRLEDYPDKGSGLTGGFFVGKTIENVEPCPGVDMMEFNKYGKLGVGKVICAHCSRYFFHEGIYPEGELCDDAELTHFCHICKESSFNQKPWQVTAVFITFIVISIKLQLGLVALGVISLLKKRKIKQ
jgi:hypothetical protein